MPDFATVRAFVGRWMLRNGFAAFAQTLFVFTASAASADQPADIVPSGARLELLWEGGTWLEGPAQAPTGEIYFSDLIDLFKPGRLGMVRVFDPRTRKVRVFESPSFGANGMAFDGKGRLLVARGPNFGARSVTRTDISTGASELVAGLYNRRSLNGPNDLAIDKGGRVYFTDPRYSGHEPLEQPVMGVYRVDPDGSIHLIIGDIAQPNGIALSPDNKHLYVADVDPARALGSDAAPIPPPSNRVRLIQYDLSEGGEASNPQILREYDPKSFGVDGLSARHQDHEPVG